MTGIRSFVIGALSAFLLALPTAVFSADSDIDGDSYSDFVVIDLLSPLMWNGFLSSTGSTQSQMLGSMGELGNHLAPGSWSAPGSYEIGILSHNEDSGAVTWIISNGTDVVSQFNLGKTNDALVSGGDIDGNGSIDAAIIRRNGVASLRLNPIGNPQDIELNFPRRFGRNGRAFYVNTGTGGDKLGVMLSASSSRSRSGGAYIALMQDQAGGTTRLRFKKTGASSLQNIMPIGLPDGSEGLLLLERPRKGSNRHLKLYNQTGQLLFTRVISRSLTALVGNYTADAGDEIALYSDGAVTIVNPITLTESTVTGLMDGVPVDHINIVKFGTTRGTDGGSGGNGGGGNGGGNNGGGGSTPGTGGLGRVCASFSGIAPGQMLVKSEISDHINSGDPRATGYTVVCGSQCPLNLNRADIYYADGSYACSVGYYGTFSGNGRPRLYGSSGGAPQHFVSSIAATARRKGNGKLYLQISRSTSGSGTSCKEFNPTGRNGDV